MDTGLKLWRWDATQLVLSDLRASETQPSWKAVIVEGRFLPGDANRSYLEYGQPDPFVSDLLWELKSRLQAELFLATSDDLRLISSRDDVESLLTSVIGETGYMFAYHRAEALRAVAFDIDIDWLAFLCENATADVVEDAIRSLATTKCRRVCDGP